MAVRNVAVAQGELTDGSFHTVYTVPAGNVLILKSVASQQQSGQAASLYVTIQHPSPLAQVLLAIVPSSSSQPGVWSGWVVLNAGDNIILQSTVASTFYWVSGAVLPFA